MNEFCCLFDACTVINLIHIDEEDFILKKVRNLDIYLNEKVFSEIRENVYDRLENNNSKYLDKSQIDNFRKSINQTLAFYRGKQNNNDLLLNDLGKSFFERIRKLTNYNKVINGELCSTGYALYLSRYNKKKVFFYTDDFPAKKYFSPFFDFQQIGQIKDSVDLLILLYWLEENFSEIQLKNFLSELYSQYTTQIVLLKDALQNFYREKVDANFIRSYKEIAQKLRELIQKLNNLDFSDLGLYKTFFFNKKSKWKLINDIIERYSTVFDLEINTNEENLLNKIDRIKTSIKISKIYKWQDLLE